MLARWGLAWAMACAGQGKEPGAWSFRLRGLQARSRRLRRLIAGRLPGCEPHGGAEAGGSCSAGAGKESRLAARHEAGAANEAGIRRAGPLPRPQGDGDPYCCQHLEEPISKRLKSVPFI